MQGTAAITLAAILAALRAIDYEKGNSGVKEAGGGVMHADGCAHCWLHGGSIKECGNLRDGFKMSFN